jgi:CIC family chloride channel protein
VRVSSATRFDEILRLVAESPHVEFYVVDDRGDLVGEISLSSLRELLLDQEALRHVMVAGDLAVPSPPTVTEDDDLDTAMQVLGHSDRDEVAVVDAAHPGRLVGTLTAQHLIDAYNAEVLRRDLAGGMSSTLGITGRVRQVALGGGYVVQEIDAPLSFWGRSLRDLEVRSRHGVQVVLIRTPSAVDSAQRVRVPTSTECVREGDTLVVTGPKEAVDALMHA